MAERKLYRPSWAAWVGLFLHVLWLVVLGYVIWIGPAGGPALLPGIDMSLPTCSPCESLASSISSARQMQRFDLIGVSLAVLGAVFASMAFAGFFVVRSAAMMAAREEAAARTELLVRDAITPELVTRVLSENPHLMLAAMREAGKVEPDVNSDDAEQIATQA